MATVVNFDFKQSYNLDNIQVVDLSYYDDRTAITSFTLEFWDWELGSGNTEDINTFTITDSDAAWTDFWDGIQEGVMISAIGFGLIKIPDGSYWFRVTLNDGTTDYVSNIDAYGFYQEIKNKYTIKHLSYDWTNRYREDSKEIYEIGKLTNWFQALELSVQPGSLIGNFNEILVQLKKYLNIS